MSVLSITFSGTTQYTGQKFNFMEVTTAACTFYTGTHGLLMTSRPPDYTLERVTTRLFSGCLNVVWITNTFGGNVFVL